MSAENGSQLPASRSTNTPRRVLIVGGVAGGASCAARLRRFDETVETARDFDHGQIPQYE
jgi:hypothetical protein